MKTLLKTVSVLSLGFVLAACSKPADKGDLNEDVQQNNEDVQQNNEDVQQNNEDVQQNNEDVQQNIERWPLTSGPLKDEKLEKDIDKLLHKMTLEEKVGQVMQAEIQQISPEEVKQYHIGSVLNGGGSVPGRKKNATAGDWLALADQYWDASMDDSDGHVAIPIFWGTDAVHGNGNLHGATIFPHNIGLGAARNPELIRDIGKVTAKEVRTTGVEWVFAPTLAVARDDRWGRTYESYSEDPLLVKSYSDVMVHGLQGEPGKQDFLSEERVLATAKHFLADGGTWTGDDQGDARMDENELMTIHGPGYPTAIEAGVQTVMSSFSSWNGEKMHANKYLLTDVLKERMGFDGLVVGDWNGHGQVPGCSNTSCPQAFNAGIDLFMVPTDWRELYANTLAQVKSGEISTARLDDAVRRILRVKLRAKLFDKKPSERALSGQQEWVGHPEHRALAQRAVRESLVLLKNKDKILPLNPKQHILVTGAGADSISMQSGGWSVSWQGRGITNEQFPGATSIYSGIKAAVEKAGGSVELSQDANAKKKPDVAIVVFGELPYAEGNGDVATLEFEPGKKSSLALLKSLKAKGIPVVSVFLSGRPLWVNPELNASDAFVAAWLPGSEGAGVADVIIADSDGQARYDFSGTLSFSWPKDPLQATLNLSSASYNPLFAYGHGLNYKQGGEGPGQLPEDLPGVASGDIDKYDLYRGQAMQPWVMRIQDPNKSERFSGAYAALPSGKATVNTADKDVQEDALLFKWHDLTYAGLSLEDGEPLDLSAFLSAGTLTFDIRVDDLANADMALALHCGKGCERRLEVSSEARALQGKGWQTLSYPLRCFAKAGDDFASITIPFQLRASGQGKLAIANIQLKRAGSESASCD